MLWCPKCGAEYRDGFEVCSDCQERLVSYPVEILPPESAKLTEYSFLMNVPDGFVCDIIKSKLESFHIPCDIQYTGAAQYIKIFMGTSPEGANIYVPTELLEDARKVVEQPSDLDENEDLWKE